MQSAPSLCSLNGHKGAVLCCYVHEGLLITAGHDKKIIVWDAASNTIKLEIAAHDHIINGLDICWSGKYSRLCILSASWDKTVKVWDLNSGELISTFLGHSNRVKTVKTLPNNPQIHQSPTNRFKAEVQVAAASGDDDGHIYVWNIQTGEALLNLDEHNRFIAGLATYLDASGIMCLVSVSADASIRLWDVSDLPQAPTSSQHNAAHRQSKAATCSSICVIKTPSKHISSLCTASVCADAPLITGHDASCVKSALPPISPARKLANTVGTASNAANTTSAASTTISTNTDNATETIILAADTLGSIYVYRARTGVLLVRLEAMCKIVTLFTTHEVLSAPYFPNEEDMHGYYTGISSTIASGSSSGSATSAHPSTDSSLYITPERDAMLVQAAGLKRQHYIASRVSHRNAANTSASGTGSAIDNPSHGTAKYVHYVSDNGSVGCFCLLPDMYVHSSSSSASISNMHSAGANPSSSVDVTTSIVLTQTVKLDLCRAMNTLCGAAGATSGANDPKRRKSIDLSLDKVGGAKKSSTASSAVTSSSVHTNIVYDTTEGGSGNSSVCVSANNSTKSTTTSAGTGTKVLQAFNSSAVPSAGKGKGTATSRNTASATTGIISSGVSTGGVMSVSINTADTVSLLLQCFAVTSTTNSTSTTNGTNANSSNNNNNTTHYMVLGGRDSILFNCPFNPSPSAKTLKSPRLHADQDTKTHLSRPSHIVLPRPGLLMPDVPTPSVSPLYKDNIEHGGISATISTSRSSNSGNGSPAHSPQKPHTPHLPQSMLHSPKKGDNNMHGSHYCSESPLASPTHTCSTGVSFRGDSFRGDSARGSNKGSSGGYSGGGGGGVVVGGGEGVLITATPHITSATDSAHSMHSTLPSGEQPDDGADLEDEMSLSEVSHIHHYYDDLLHGRITQRPADDPLSNNKSANNKTHLSALLRAKSTINKDFESGAEIKTEYGEPVYEGSMLEYLHMLDMQDGANAAPPGAHNLHPTTTSTSNNTSSNTNTNTATTNTYSSSNASVSGYASIVSNSTMNSNFWEAANTALSKYSFRRIRLQSKPHTTSNTTNTTHAAHTAHTTHTTHTTRNARIAYSTHAGTDAAGGIGVNSVVIYPGNNTSANNTMVHGTSVDAAEHSHFNRALKPKLNSHHVHNAHSNTHAHTHSNSTTHSTTNLHDVDNTTGKHTVHPIHNMHNSLSTPSVQRSRSERLKQIQNNL